ncbi:MAG TPA: hypothetical protein VI636_22565 [Candidatus Angelobacter sp.]
MNRWKLISSLLAAIAVTLAFAAPDANGGVVRNVVAAPDGRLCLACSGVNKWQSRSRASPTVRVADGRMVTEHIAHLVPAGAVWRFPMPMTGLYNNRAPPPSQFR